MEPTTKKMFVMRGKSNLFNVNLRDVALSYFVGVYGCEEKQKETDSGTTQTELDCENSVRGPVSFQELIE